MRVSCLAHVLVLILIFASACKVNVENGDGRRASIRILHPVIVDVSLARSEGSKQGFSRIR